MNCNFFKKKIHYNNFRNILEQRLLDGDQQRIYPQHFIMNKFVLENIIKDRFMQPM